MKERFLLSLYILLYIPLAMTLAAAVIRGRYPGMVLCLVSAVLYLAPVFIEKWLSVKIPPLVKYMMILFIFLCLYLGGAVNLFLLIPFWDKLIHFLSGFLWVTLFLSVPHLFSGNPHFLRQMKPAFTALWVVLAAVSAGTIWEWVEFLADLAFQTGLQHNEGLFGASPQNALADTMTDLIAGFLGALVMSMIYLRAMKKDQWLKLEKVLIRRAS